MPSILIYIHRGFDHKTVCAWLLTRLPQLNFSESGDPNSILIKGLYIINISEIWFCWIVAFVPCHSWHGSFCGAWTAVDPGPHCGVLHRQLEISLAPPNGSSASRPHGHSWWRSKENLGRSAWLSLWNQGWNQGISIGCWLSIQVSGWVWPPARHTPPRVCSPPARWGSRLITAGLPTSLARLRVLPAFASTASSRSQWCQIERHKECQIECQNKCQI